MNYSNVLIAIRAEMNLTQADLATLLNVSFATVNRWENNKTIPSNKHLFKIKDLCTKNNINFYKLGESK